MKKLRTFEPNHFESGDEIINYCFPSSFIDGMLELVEKNISAPFTLSIDGNWGSGKTHLMKIIEDKLNNDDFPTIWFNPWEYEKTNSVYLAFLKTIAIAFKGKFNIKDLGVFGLTLAISGIDTISRLITNGNLNYSNIKEITNDVSEASEDEIDKFSDITKELKSKFVDITNKLPTKFEGRPLVIFIDDLDRCLPKDTLELLEALKNTFNVKNANAIFICGQNSAITKDFIKDIYPAMDYKYATSYFKKIFDYSIRIPGIETTNLKRFIDYRIDEMLNTIQNDSLTEYIVEINTKVSNQSLRVLNKLIYGYCIYDIMNSDNELELEFVISWLFFKEVWPEEYDKILHEILITDTKTFGSIRNFKSLVKLQDSSLTNYLSFYFTKFDELKLTDIIKSNIL